MFGHSPGVLQSPTQQHFDMGVDTAKFVVGPADQCVVHRRIDPQQDLPALAHV